MKIGILGAGQLGRMLALAGYPLDFDFVFLDPAQEACAAPLGEHIHAAYDDDRGLAEFCVAVDLATYEFENVPAHTAEFVSSRIPLYPAPLALTVGQDRLSEKQMFDKLKIPVPRYMPVAAREALDIAVKNIGLPGVLKTRRLGYDGKGQAVLRASEDVGPAWDRIGKQPLILEAFCPFEREISCLAVRGREGEMAFYPVVENQHRDGILRVSTPRLNDPLQQQAEVQLATLAGNADIRVEDHPLYQQAKAAVDEAQRQLNHATVRAPFDGVVTQVDSLQPGTYLVSQTAALTATGAVALVSASDVWVTAQMKETELTYVKAGDRVDVTIDTYPGMTFKGTVESISPASGSEFSILPPENSSGNFVKVVQRVPVKIAIDQTPGGPVLRAGMSAYVSIDTGHRRSLSDLF